MQFSNLLEGYSRAFSVDLRIESALFDPLSIKLSFGTAKQGMALPDTLLDLLIVEIWFKHGNSISWSHRLLSLRDLGLVVVLFSVKNFQGQSV